MKTIKLLAIAFVGALTLQSCSSDDDNPEIVNEEEVITKMTIELTATPGATPIVIEFDDPDGDGPGMATITGGTLAANTSYRGTIELFDESDPADIEDITEEVEEEDDEHQFFFTTTGNVGTITYSDMDGDGNPVGLIFSLATGNATSGTLTVTLRHEPMKDATGVSTGDITNAGGETDIEVTFPITIQ